MLAFAAVIQLVSTNAVAISTPASLAIPAQAGTHRSAGIRFFSVSATVPLREAPRWLVDGSRPAPGWRDLRRRCDEYRLDYSLFRGHDGKGCGYPMLNSSQ